MIVLNPLNMAFYTFVFERFEGWYGIPNSSPYNFVKKNSNFNISSWKCFMPRSYNFTICFFVSFMLSINIVLVKRFNKIAFKCSTFIFEHSSFKCSYWWSGHLNTFLMSRSTDHITHHTYIHLNKPMLQMSCTCWTYINY